MFSGTSARSCVGGPTAPADNLLGVRVALWILFWAVLIGVLEALFPPALLFRPAVGACVAALLLRGQPASLAVFLGIFVAASWLGQSQAQALVQAAADCLQSWLALTLVRRQLGFPNPLAQTRELVRFHGLIGPCACLLGSSLKVLGLLCLSLPRAYPPLAFFLMDWVGQVLGAVILTTPLLSLFDPDPAWKRRRSSVAVPTMFLIVVSLYGRAQVQKQVDRLEHVDLHREAQTLAQDLQARLRECCALLYAVDAFSSARGQRSGPSLPGQLPWPRLLVHRRADGTFQQSGDLTRLASARQLLDQAGEPLQPRALALEPGWILIMVPAVTPKEWLAGVFPLQEILTPALSASRRDPTTRFRLLLGQTELLVLQPTPPLKPPLIHDQVVLDQGFRVEVSRRFDTNRPRVGLPVAFALYSFLLLYLLRMSNQASRLEQAMLAARQADQAKSLFLGNMSHEIRTPMNGILGLTRLVLQSGLTPAQAEQLRHAERSGQALLTLLNDLLEISKMESGGLSSVAAPESLERLLEQTVRSLGLAAEARGLEILLTVGLEVPDAIVVDGNRLGQVLLNLLGNAIKFTLSGQVELTVLLLGWQERMARLRFSVRDTGIGIPAEKLQNIFEPFVQANSTVSGQTSGVGLGLAISRHLVEGLGGRLQVESQPGQGSTFSFELLCPGQLPEPVIFPDDFRPEEIPCEICLAHRETGRSLEALLRQWNFPTATEAQPARLLLADETTFEAAAGRGLPAVVLVPLGRLGALFSRCQASGGVPLLRPALPRAFHQAILQALCPAAEEKPNVPVGPLQAYRGQRALVADDHATNRLLASLLLERMGFTVDSVGDGQAAVAACASATYDLLVMDVRMPHLDGYAASQAIRRSGVVTPIIISTAQSPEPGHSLEQAGVQAILPKPITEQSLRAAVVAVLASREEGLALREALLTSVAGDLRSARAVARAFLDELPELCDLLEEESGRGNLLHRLKGSIEVFGETPLLALCGESQTPSRDRLKAALARMELLVQAVWSELNDES